MSHWYTQEGKPCYEVPNTSKGGMRPTTIRDARKLQLVPSVTTIIDIIDKPALTSWKIDQALDAAKDFFQEGEESIEIIGTAWKSIVLQNSQKISRDSAKKGSEIHNALENCLTEGLEHPDYKKYQVYCDSVFKLLSNNELHNGESERSFTNNNNFGGKVDWSGRTFILDFKTKDSDDFTKQLAYDGHLMQLAAYRLGLNNPTAKCYNLFISTVKPGLVKLHEWTEEEVQRGEKMFTALLKYWQYANNFSV